ncbi:MAG: hypothetical protein HGA51_03185 [Demequinaceae bacterium]|nr:hypothetical protein [Demequinaceae bacterium]
MYGIGAVGARIVLATTCALLTTTACFPQGNIAQRMPLMAEWTDSGDLEVVFPLCEGQVIANLGLTGEIAGKWWTLRQGDPDAPVTEDEVVRLVIGEDQLGAGSLSDRWPVIRAFEIGHPTNIREFEYVFVNTKKYAAGIDIEDIREGDSWLIDGDTVDHQTSPVAVNSADGMAQIDAFCDAQRS